MLMHTHNLLLTLRYDGERSSGNLISSDDRDLRGES